MKLDCRNVLKKTIAVFGIVVLLTLLCVGCKPTQPSAFALDLRTDSDFKVLQIADLHEWMFIEDGFEEQDTLKPATERFINALLDQEKPDLVVLTGDNVFPLSAFAELFLKITLKTYGRFATLMEEREQPWTLTFGNHDTESFCSKEQVLKEMSKYQYFVGGLEDGENYSEYHVERTDEASYADFRYGNFHIPVRNKKGEIFYQITLLDSGSYAGSPAPKGAPYRFITDDLVDWYLEKQKGLENVPSLIFTHIPLFEHMEAYEQGHDQTGEWDGFSPSDTRSTLFERALEVGNLKGIMAGHNHETSVTAIWDKNGDGHGVMMGITPCLQTDDYEDETGWHSARVLTLKQDGGLESKILQATADLEIVELTKNRL